MKMPLQDRPDRWAAIAASVGMLGLAIYVYVHRFVEGRALVGERFWRALFWDARVFDIGGQYVFQNENPYLAPVYNIPFDLPFISPPLIAYLFGVASGVLGALLFPLLAISHLVALALTPLILTKLFFGRTWTDLALGYALFICGLGAWGVTTILAGNFGATLYLFIFAAMVRGVKLDRWRLFHIAVAVAVQVKPPYALLWVIPVMLNGWSCRQAKYAAIAAVAAAAPFALSYLFDPSFFRDWLGALTQQVRAGDVGFSMYGAVFSRVWPDVTSSAPMIAHVLTCAALGIFLLFDKTRGPLRLAALITFAVLANPRMKEYDMAFAAIPIAALYLAAFAPEGADPMRRALGIGGLFLLMAALLKCDHLPVIGPFIYVIAMAGAILTLAAPAIRARIMAPARA